MAGVKVKLHPMGAPSAAPRGAMGGRARSRFGAASRAGARKARMMATTARRAGARRTRR